MNQCLNPSNVRQRLELDERNGLGWRSLLSSVDPALHRARQRLLCAPALSLGPDPAAESGRDRRLLWRNHGIPNPVSQGLRCQTAIGTVWLGGGDWTALDAVWAAPACDLPSSELALLVESVLEPVTAALARLWQGPARAIAVETLAQHLGENPSHQLVGFSVLVDDNTSIAMWSATTLDGLQQMAQRQQVERSWSLAAVASLPVWLPVQRGYVKLQWADLAAMAPGDLLRPDEIGFVGDGGGAGCAVRLPMTGADGQWLGAWMGRWQDHRIELESYVMTEMHAPESSPLPQSREVEGDAPPLETLGQLPCTVVIELARLSLTMAEVARMRVGQSLELPSVGSVGTVRLVVQGRTVGAGELINVGQDLAVMVTSWVAQSPPGEPTLTDS